MNITLTLLDRVDRTESDRLARLAETMDERGTKYDFYEMKSSGPRGNTTFIFVPAKNRAFFDFEVELHRVDASTPAEAVESVEFDMNNYDD